MPRKGRVKATNAQYAVQDVTVSASLDGPGTLVTSSANVGGIAAGETKSVAAAGSIKFTVGGGTSAFAYDHPVILNMNVSSKHTLSGDTYTGKYKWTFHVARARLEVVDVDTGSSPGILPGNSGNIHLTLKNTGNESIPAGNLTSTLTPGTCITGASGTLTLAAALAPGASVRLASPLNVTVDAGCVTADTGQVALSNFSYTNSSGQSIKLPGINIPVDVGLHYTVTVEPDYTFPQLSNATYEVELPVPASIDAGQNAKYVASRTFVELDGMASGFDDTYYARIELIHPDDATVALLKDGDDYDYATTEYAIRATYGSSYSYEDPDPVFGTLPMDADGDWTLKFTMTTGKLQHLKKVGFRIFYTLQ